MFRDSQNVVTFFYIVCLKVIIINSKTTLWKLSSDKTKIIEVNPFHAAVSSSISNSDRGYLKDDALFDIIASTEHFGQSWVKQPIQYYCTTCQYNEMKNAKSSANANTSQPQNRKSKSREEILDCGKPVNFTYYDNLVGVLNRDRHPSVPEPQAILFLNRNYGKNRNDLKDFDIDLLEQKLRKAKKDKPKSVQLYNQIGNFWRIKGDNSKAIECFRRALSVSPNNPEILLHLARVLFSLQYLDDAIYLTRRSLEVQPPEIGAWRQYFTLGEIFKAYGHYQEASIHLRHTLELNPDFEPAHLALKEMESMPSATVHIYTMVIIVCLVLGVFLVILSSVDGTTDYTDEMKPQRHFNKAMAMRSLKGITITVRRCKKSPI